MGSNDKTSFMLSILILCLVFSPIFSILAFMYHLVPIQLRICFWIAAGLYIISSIILIIGTGQNKVLFVGVGFCLGLITWILGLIATSIGFSYVWVGFTYLGAIRPVGTLNIVVSIIDIICSSIIFFRRGKL